LHNVESISICNYLSNITHFLHGVTIANLMVKPKSLASARAPLGPPMGEAVYLNLKVVKSALDAHAQGN
jgi:hypothetical protein